MDFLALIVLAILGESVWETLKMVWQDGKASIDRIGALVVSTVIVFGTGIDVISMVGVDMKWKPIGLLLTAILISRGATFIHELITKVSNVKVDHLKVYEADTIIKNDGVAIKDGELIIRTKQGDRVEFKEFKQDKDGNITFK